VAAPVVAEVIEEAIAAPAIVEDTIVEATAPVIEETVIEEATAPIASFAETAEIAIQDTVDTVKAVAEVVGEKIEDFIEELTGDKSEEEVTEA
jgi:hypothetical protein